MKKRMLAGLMAACILWTTLPASAFQEDGPAEPAASPVADGDTRYGYKNVLGEDATSTQNAGRMWVDHTVSTEESLTFDDGGKSETITRVDGEDFLVTYSALSSTSEVSILPDTTPSDTIFVLDFSMTMNRNMNGEYVTDVRLEFPQASPGFTQTKSMRVFCQVLPSLPKDYRITNRADVGGRYGNEWESALTSWNTTVWTNETATPLPKTGY